MLRERGKHVSEVCDSGSHSDLTFVWGKDREMCELLNGHISFQFPSERFSWFGAQTRKTKKAEEKGFALWSLKKTNKT